MRDFLDAILAFINSESLTEEEFDSLDITEQTYTLDTYTALRTIIEARDNVSGQVDRLGSYFTARGVDISSADAVPTPHSNIFIGDGL